MTFPPQLVASARKAAAVQSLDPTLVCPVIEQESCWNSWAMRQGTGAAFFAKYCPSLHKQQNHRIRSRPLSNPTVF
jgi:hypothetical protein